MQRPVFGDCAPFERAPWYQGSTGEIYFQFLIRAARNHIAVEPALFERVERMRDFLLAVRRPDGTMPQMGDADGGYLLPLAPRAPDDLRGLFAVAAAFLGRADCAWAAGVAEPEAAWLL